jgi:hypothetical protein
MFENAQYKNKKWIVFNSNPLYWLSYTSRYGGHRISSSVLQGFDDGGVCMCALSTMKLVSPNTLFPVAHLKGSFNIR